MYFSQCQADECWQNYPAGPRKDSSNQGVPTAKPSTSGKGLLKFYDLEIWRNTDSNTLH